MFTIAVERPQHAAAILRIHDAALGLDRFQKTVYRLRDGLAPVGALCFVALEDGEVRASNRHWSVIAGGAPALMLGPLAVDPPYAGKGFGKALMWHSLAAAKALGHKAVILVGDPEYYEPFGFTRRPVLGLTMPGWVEARRLLGLELEKGALAGAEGLVRRGNCQSVAMAL
jgi:predicted N-acetyltransferase YhbS